ncbi:YjcQ family protein [Paenibacillus sp. J5C_2022]|uniref:YjcQ family protein n=1 Tax=Paenibacillus sp. J5C2022 TaxID=2977129 RepID=UPI0021D1B7E6|nr:YjcQ family protein [Paenibacillus sp. J5C2022]MCU6709418.1 YjcQ family protein [Paenibacillus sp. J5C2022]
MKPEKLNYAILKEVEKGNVKFTHDTYGVIEEDFIEAMRYISRNGYVKGILWADDTAYNYNLIHLTPTGEEFIKNNSILVKSYSLLKELRDWIK